MTILQVGQTAYMLQGRGAEKRVAELNKQHTYTQTFEDSVWDKVYQKMNVLYEEGKIDCDKLYNNLDSDDPKWGKRENEDRKYNCDVFMKILNDMGLTKVTRDDIFKQMGYDKNKYKCWYGANVTERDLYE